MTKFQSQDKSNDLKQSISIRSAQQLSITTNTAPQIPSLTPRWLLRLLSWVNVENGIYRINQVRFQTEDVEHRLFVDNNSEEARQKSASYFSSLLKQVSLFKKMPEAVINELVKNLNQKKVEPGEVIIKEGTFGDAFYIILSGQFEVTVQGKRNKNVVLKTFTGGEYFGELALLEEAPRQASITAISRGDLIVLNKKTFVKMTADLQAKSLLDQILMERKKNIALSSEYGECQVPLLSGHSGQPVIPNGYADYHECPTEIHLSIIQSILSVHTRVTDLYNKPFDQLEQQLRVVLENIKEREEWEIINNKEFGLLNNVSLDQIIQPRNGAPTPDDLDALIRLVWKKPSFFLAHPMAIEAFARECTYRGVPPVMVQMFGSSFISWRGLPLIPSDKLRINNDNLVPTSDIVLIRTGEQDQGVVALHRENIRSGYKKTNLSVQPMGINEHSVANYLVTKYFSVAILVPDAIAVLKNVEMGHHHNYD